ncbi:MAG TPA: arginase [Thermoanaerobacterales bacterium]|nr:arginase [Thermoanaerobacterales bacterium]
MRDVNGCANMLNRVLISIDWDYFIKTEIPEIASLRENYWNIYLRWYREYLKNPGIELKYSIMPDYRNFWDKLRQKYSINELTVLFISESHKYSYYLAKRLKCNKVVNFDAHADLGYGYFTKGYYTHCANWLGRLVYNKNIEEAVIVYSPYTKEKEEEFEDTPYIRFACLNALDRQMPDEVVAGIHICRSGAWTPPWFDDELYSFIDAGCIMRKRGFLRKRQWKPHNIDYSKVTELMLHS